MRPKYLHGLHDRGGEHLMSSRPGWVVVTEAIGANPNDHTGRDYSDLTSRGFGVIVRLNHGYGLDGTIPIPERYEAFAERAMNFIRSSRGCERWIIGNEPNHVQERPQGLKIVPALYAQCFRMISGAVRSWDTSRQMQLIPAAVAPWNESTGDWCEYQREMLTLIDDRADGIALHTGTHGPQVELITSEAKMEPPYQDRRFNFHAYRDLLAYVPAHLRHLPVYITEADNQDGAWPQQDTGWVQAAYLDVARWNNEPDTQPVDCLCLYRWSRDDQWCIQDNPAIVSAFQSAVNGGWTVPETRLAAEPKQKTFIPAVFGGEPEEEPGGDPLPPREWDEDLTRRGVTLGEYAAQPGESYWRLVHAEYRDERESGGRHHIYVDVLDADGERLPGVDVRVWWADDEAIIRTEPKPGEEAAANYPMKAAGWAYSAQMLVGPSDQVHGMGLGSVERPDWAIHVSYFLVWEWVTMPAATMEIPESKPDPAADAMVTVTRVALNPKVTGAVLAAEATQPFDAEGRMTIRFEERVFLSRATSAKADDFFRAGEYRHGYGSDWRAIHTGRQADEWMAFQFALGIDGVAAYESISMGSGQVMGFNFGRAGFSSALEMFEALGQSVEQQVLAAANFILADAELTGAINRGDWPVIGARYNGAAAAGERYRAAYERLWS